MATQSRRPPKAVGLEKKVAELFERAVRAHASGDIVDAESNYELLLGQAPSHAEALNNLGAIKAARGQREEATALLLRAIEAEPRYGEALNNLGLLRSEAHDYEAAVEYFRRAVQVSSNADWLNNLGNACVEMQQFSDGLRAYDRAVAIRSDDAKYWSNRGIALRGLRRPTDAIASFERALALDPGHVNALSNMGVIYKEEKVFPPAIAAYEKALALEPDNAALVANFATVFETMGDLERMRDLAQRALDLDPSYPESHNLLANYELEAGRYEAAEALYQKALSLDPSNRNANWNLAIIWLLRGDFERGWKQFESRRRLQSVVVDTTSTEGPEWKGEPLNGRTILIVTEQGIGDAVQFIRYARDLKRRGAGRVIVECPWPIAPLLNGVPGVDQAVARGVPLPAYDTWANLMSLPALLRTTLETVPADVPYIVAEPRPVADVVKAAAGNLRIGIVWAGNPVHKRDFLRSAELTRFRPLLDIPGTRFFSIQKGEEGERQLAAFNDPRITDLAPQLNDLRDTAAVIEQLDLVISVDTSMAHLAGAMGKPTWLLLPHVPDFRWLLDRDDSPWYPTMRLFRQPVPRRWDAVFAAVEAELRALASRAPAGSSGTSTSAPNDPMVTTLEAATRFVDGRPRFDVWIPLARLADPTWFAEYEAELVGGGHHRELRAFWDEAGRTVDAVVDLTPGIGLVTLSFLSAPHPPHAVCVVESNDDDARRLRSILVTRPRGDTAIVVSDPVEAIATLVLKGHRTIGIHAGNAAAITAFYRAWDGAGIRPDVEIVTCAAAGTPESPAWRSAPMWDGLVPLAVRIVDGEVHIDQLMDDDGDVNTAWISGLALERLGSVPDEPAPGLSTPPTGDAQSIAFAPMGSSFTSTITSPAPETSPNARDSARVHELGIDWELRGDTGWGVYGTNLALELVKRGGIQPGILAVDETSLSPVARWRLRDVLRETAARRSAVANPQAPVQEFRGTMLRGLGNSLTSGPFRDRVRADRNVGMIFFEDTAFDAEAVARAASLELIVAGSTWNGDVLRGAGFANVATVFQGIDPTVFHPAPKSGLLADRFVIFSGGKLEYRKGQDIVVAAFRRFRERHPEALLVTAWHNAWPHLISDLELAGHVKGAPRYSSHGMLITEWLSMNGVPAEASLDIGKLPNALMGAVVREADAALFPNRCEGGTNLVAMECMAAGVPTIVSSNTGHLDLVATGGCVPLERQSEIIPPTRFYSATDGWGESDVDEMVDALERVWSDRTAAQTVAARGAEVMQDWTWLRQIERLLQVLKPFIDT